LLKACSHCGSVNEQAAEACTFCHAPFGLSDDVPDAVSVPSSEPEWRLEVAHRLEAYQARRGRNRSAAGNSGTPSRPAGGRASAGAAGGPDSGAPDTSKETGTPGAHRQPAPYHGGTGPAAAGKPEPLDSARGKRGRVGIEIAVLQPEFDFSAAEGYRIHPAPPLVPVAGLRERLCAGLWDAAFLLLNFGGFLLLFRSLGGRFSFGKLDAAVYAVAFFLLFAQYFALFTVFGGGTPGMRLLRLRVVRFDGGDPAPAQLLLRSFGYLVSAGTLFLGFLWSLWDEDQLTWQDRISQTYITDAPA